MQDDGDADDEQQERGAAAGMQTAHAGRRGGVHVAPGLEGMDDLVLRAMILEHAPDIGHERDGPDIAHEDQALEQAVPQMEGEPFHPAAQIQPLHEQRQQVRHDHEQAHGHGQGKQQGQHQMPALELFLGAFGLMFRGTVERLDAVDQGLDEHGKAAHERLFQPGMPCQREPGHAPGHDLAVGTAQGQRVGVTIAHHDAFKDGLSAHGGAAGRQHQGNKTGQAHRLPQKNAKPPAGA